MLSSKIYESYILNWLSSEASCKTNQYGGVKGCSFNHLLVGLWDEIGWNLENDRATTLIRSINYVKAINRLSPTLLEGFCQERFELRHYYSVGYFPLQPLHDCEDWEYLVG